MAHAMSGSIDGSPPAEKSRQPWFKRVLIVIALAALPLIAWSAWDRDLITRWKQTASPLPFFLGMALAPAFGVPISPLFVLAGATFGGRIGLIGSGLALAANLTLCYWIARSGLRPWLVRLLRRFDYELPDFKKKYEGSWRFTLMVKATPAIPQFVKNYGLGVAGVPFPLYFGSSMLLTGAYGVALIVLGESLFRHNAARSSMIAAAVAVLALGIWTWSKRKKRQSPPND
jgi:uncharacterized membrane protein YdjX (TVP38/TMEM64 family)